MIVPDPIDPYVPILWGLVHPKLIRIALKASARRAVELKEIDGKLYWRRFIDDPHLELGL